MEVELRTCIILALNTSSPKTHIKHCPRAPKTKPHEMWRPLSIASIILAAKKRNPSKKRTGELLHSAEGSFLLSRAFIKSSEHGIHSSLDSTLPSAYVRYPALFRGWQTNGNRVREAEEMPDRQTDRQKGWKCEMHSRPDKRESETERKEIHRNKEKREAWEMNEERDKGKWEERN